jgi:cell division protein ZapE
VSTPAQAEAAPAGPLRVYLDGAAAGRWLKDAAQLAALRELERIHTALLDPPKAGLLDRLRGRRPVAPRGLYLWGGVGRGKTFMVDLFYEQLPITAKRRVHFHRFMTEVHERLRALPGREDPLAEVAEDLADEIRLLCLDEFFVVDIGDAMILGRLLQHLIARGVCLVTTSNTVPDNLYRDGLQRERFLPAIALLNAHCVVHEIASATDYRLRNLRQGRTWLVPDDATAEAELAALFERLTIEAAPGGAQCEINGRTIPCRRQAEGVVWFDFEALCEGPRAVADYIELARDFHTVLLSGLPQMDVNRENAARRFVHLVDEFYDRAVNLVVAAAVPIIAVYVGDRLRHEYERTTSRLIEMQSEDYLGREHRP